MVARIGSLAFADCNYLSIIRLGPGIKTVGKMAFWWPSDRRRYSNLHFICWAKDPPELERVDRYSHDTFDTFELDFLDDLSLVLGEVSEVGGMLFDLLFMNVHFLQDMNIYVETDRAAAYRRSWWYYTGFIKSMDSLPRYINPSF